MKREAQRRSETGRNASILFAGILMLVLAAATTVAAGETKPDPGRPDPGLTSVGKSVYKSYCSSCHGTAAQGDGPVAEFLRVPPTDLTRVARENGGEYPFEEVVKVIDGREKVRAHGSDMPIWGDVFQEAEGGGGEAEAVRQKVTGLAHYLWSIQAGEGS